MDRLPHSPDFKEFDLLKDAIKKKILIKKTRKKKYKNLNGTQNMGDLKRGE